MKPKAKKQIMNDEYFASINSVSQELGIPAYTLRYWEKQFPTVVRPVAGAGGRRYYRPEMVARLRTIQDLLYNRGLTIAGVKKLIRSGEFSAIDDGHDQWAPAPKPRPDLRAPKQNFEPLPKLQNPYQDFMPERLSGPVSIDLTKVDAAIGLLNQARELLN